MDRIEGVLGIDMKKIIKEFLRLLFYRIDWIMLLFINIENIEED